MARTADSYRSARRNDARRRGLIWRLLPRVKGKGGETLVVVARASTVYTKPEPLRR